MPAISEHGKVWLARMVDVRPVEMRALLAAFFYFFFLLASYFVLRPLRDEMGVAAGREALQWLFTATFAVMLAASPLYASTVARLSRARFIPLVYRFFIANLAIFWLLLEADVNRVWVARVFFVWVSVFNLFAVSVFWSFMADIFSTAQGKRLFGFIAAGGTLGTLVGSSFTASLAGLLGVTNLLVAAALMLEIAVYFARRLEHASNAVPRTGSAIAQPMDGGMFAGFALMLRSPYLAGIALWVALLSLAGTFFYFFQQDVVRAASADPATRTRIFAAMDLGANLLTLGLQLAVSGQVIKRLGAGPAAAILPFVFVLGFAGLVFAPSLALIVGLQVAQRTANFAFSNPAREIFFTSVAREEKYKAKSLIDTAIFRGGDVAWSWSFTGLLAAGLGMMQIALVAVPVALGWLVLSLALGRAQEARAKDTTDETGRQT